MADDSAVEEKAALKAAMDEAATADEMNDSKARFIPNGGDHKVEVETSSSGEVSFTGLGKEDLLRYANDPFWKKVRMILFILFWVGWVAMFAAAIIIIVLAPRCPHRPDMKWYDKQASYQVYPKSFKDTNKPDKAAPGEGVGDLPGILSELGDGGHFKDLGVETLYINSFFKNGGVDNGMDVVDYKEVDPSLGTLDDLKKLRKTTKDIMRLVIDFIPNHTSRNHTWFMKSQQKEDPYTDYYHWAPCTEANPKPAIGGEMKSEYGESAWTYDKVRQECYYHSYLMEEPDLNLMNDDVKKEMRGVLDFWTGLGFDGFFVRNADRLVENMTLGDTGTTHQPESMELLTEWRALLDAKANKPGREKALIVAVDTDVNTTMKYYGVNGKKGANFVQISPIKAATTTNLATHLRDRIQEVAIDDANRKYWSLNNEETSRIASQLGQDYLIPLLAVQTLLPGTTSTYYGDEIGMINGNPLASSNDPLSKISGQVSRDPFRSPMQWDASPNAGFTDKDFTPWIPVASNYQSNNVQHAKAYHSKNSIMDAYKAFVKLGGKESIQFGKTKVNVLSSHPDVFWMTRKAEGFPGYLVIINLGSASMADSFKEAEIPDKVEQVFHSHGSPVEGSLDLSDRAISIDPKNVHVYKYE